MYIIFIVYGFYLKACELETWPVTLGNKVLGITFVTKTDEGTGRWEKTKIKLGNA